MNKNEILKLQDNIDKEIKYKYNYKSLIEEELHPNLDGIICMDKYLKSQKKILWILKETNGGFDSEHESWNAREGLYEKFNKSNCPDMHYNYQTYDKMVYVSKMILENLEWSKIQNRKNNPEITQILHHTAIINLKKIPGSSKANDKTILKYYKQYKDIIWKQIDYMKPDIVICAGTFWIMENDIKKICNNKPTNKNDKYTHSLFDSGNERLYLNVYHPQYFKVTQEDYCTSIYKSVTNSFK
ncbi:MAG: hypothetical protein MUF43_13565 [Flavobacterium sp.]|jgi:hypothetical protein|nr:hypothetical protein [Flavobacterium sp.]